MKHGGSSWAESLAVDFSDNLNPLGPPPELIQLAREAVERGVYLKFPANLAEEALSQYEGLPVTIFNGATEAALALLASIGARRLVTPESEYRDYVRIAGLLDISHVFGVERAEAGDVVVLSNPGNPMGRYMPRDVLLELSKRLESRGVRLVVDESFIDFCNCPTAAPEVPVVKSYGKLLAAPGLRIGAIVGEVRQELKAPWRVNSVADYVIYMMGADGLKRHKAKTVQYIGEELPRVWNAVAGCRKTEPTDVHFFVAYGPPPRGIKVRTLEDRGIDGFRASIKTPQLDDILVEAICGDV
ncbi:MAG: aminotransferase class I/II-fold pyridoxal phosphate-dependent enzyme [Pyrobaculum sp.]